MNNPERKAHKLLRTSWNSPQICRPFLYNHTILLFWLWNNYKTTYVLAAWFAFMDFFILIQVNEVGKSDHMAVNTSKYEWIKIRKKLKQNNTSHNRCRHAQGNFEIMPFQQKWTRYMSYHTSCRFLDSLFAFCLGAFGKIRCFCTNCTNPIGLYRTQLPTDKIINNK